MAKGFMATSKGTPAWKALLDDCEDSFKRFMKVEKIVPPLVEKKLLKRKLGKMVIKQQDPGLLVSTTQAEWGPDQFLTYLEVLIELCRTEGPEGNTLKFMRVMKGSLEAVKPEPSSKLERTIQKFKETVDMGFLTVESQIQPVKSIDSQTIIAAVLSEQQASSTSSIQLSSHSPMQPPNGQIGNAVSHCFTHEGGVLYSPVHGVSVTIPPNAIPGHVEKFFLSMHFYLGHPFTLKEDVNICSVVVWFHLHPPIEFLEDVTVAIPHAVRADLTSLCVLTWGEDKQGPPYKLNTEVPADFSDGYHAVFKVRHFSPFSAGRKKDSSKKRKKVNSSSRSKRLDRFKSQTSSSLEHSFDDSCTVSISRTVCHSPSLCDHGNTSNDGMQSDNPELPSAGQITYSLVCYMPKDRSGAEWSVTFAACYNHPTGNWVSD